MIFINEYHFGISNINPILLRHFNELMMKNKYNKLSFHETTFLSMF